MTEEVPFGTLIGRWKENLLSGAFPQGRATLHKDGKYCCLGVLCETAIELGMPVARDARVAFSGNSIYAVKGTDLSDAYGSEFCVDQLEGPLRELIGLSSAECNSLAVMNDGLPVWDEGFKEYLFTEKHSFAQIAEWIAENITRDERAPTLPVPANADVSEQG